MNLTTTRYQAQSMKYCAAPPTTGAQGSHTRRKNGGCQGLGEEGMELLLNGHSFPFRKREKALWMNGGDACTTTRTYSKVTTHLKIVKVILLCYVFYTFFKIKVENTVALY